MSFDWKKLVGTVAPTLATALGGPLAGAAVGAISQAVLGKDNGTEDEISVALASASPDVLAKIKEVDNTFKVRMEELKVDLIKAQYASVDSARDMNVKKADNTARNLAYMAVTGFFTVLILQLAIGIHPTWTIDADVQRTLDVTLGILFAWVIAVKDFYFGSSQGAVVSNKSLRNIAERE